MGRLAWNANKPTADIMEKFTTDRSGIDEKFDTREDIANDSSTDSELSPSQLSAFTSSLPADILLDDDSERSHKIIKKQGRPSKNQRKRNAATAPKYIKKHGTYYRVINVFFDEKHRQDILCLGNTPTMCELDARKFPHKAVWDKLLDTYMDIDDDTVGSSTHGIQTHPV